MRLIKTYFRLVVLCMIASPIVGQSNLSVTRDSPVDGIIEIGYLNPLYSSHNINSSHHANWYGFKFDVGLRIRKRVETVFSLTSVESSASNAYFLNSTSKNQYFGGELRYHFYMSDKLLVSPKIGIGSITWTNGIELSGRRYLTGADISYFISNNLALKLKLDVVNDSFDERLPESIDVTFSGFFFQPGISFVGYLAKD